MSQTWRGKTNGWFWCVFCCNFPVLIRIDCNCCESELKTAAVFKALQVHLFGGVSKRSCGPPHLWEGLLGSGFCVGAGSPPICRSSQFVGLLFAPTVTLPCTCSSDRGWCGVGPPGRKYKPLSFRCLADKSCGGSAAPRFRHVPPTTQWGVFC